MLIIPYEVDIPFERHPFTNWLLFASIIAVFVLQLATAFDWGGAEDVVGDMEQYVLDGFGLRGLFGHMWLHADIIHLIGNLIFLWVFGNAVCQKIGNLLYFPIYLFVGLVAAFAYLIFSGGSAIGASGAINGIVGMYLVFFPVHDISCWWMWWMRFGTFTVSGFWMILLWLAFDIWGAIRGGGGVGYFAHLGGFAAGAGLGMVLLITKVAKMDEHDESLLDILTRGRKEQMPVSTSRTDFEVREMMHQRKYASLDEHGHPESPPQPGITADEILRSRQNRQPATQPSGGIIRFYCPCGQKVKMPAKYAGRQGKCPKCGHRLTIPAQTAE